MVNSVTWLQGPGCGGRWEVNDSEKLCPRINSSTIPKVPRLSCSSWENVMGVSRRVTAVPGLKGSSRFPDLGEGALFPPPLNENVQHTSFWYSSSFTSTLLLSRVRLEPPQFLLSDFKWLCNAVRNSLFVHFRS